MISLPPSHRAIGSGDPPVLPSDAAGSAVDRLLRIASAPIGRHAPTGAWASEATAVHGELARMLARRNGFYAFASALHVFPDDPSCGRDVRAWNAPTLWRDAYEGLADGCWFFAEDAFGEQFCVKDGRIHRFEPETGALTELAASVEAWAEIILADHRQETGWPVAHEWQTEHGALPEGTRLLPRMPFVTGGGYDLANLRVADAARGMRWRGELALRLRGVADGETIPIPRWAP